MVVMGVVVVGVVDVGVVVRVVSAVFVRAYPENFRSVYLSSVKL